MSPLPDSSPEGSEPPTEVGQGGEGPSPLRPKRPWRGGLCARTLAWVRAAADSHALARSTAGRPHGPYALPGNAQSRSLHIPVCHQARRLSIAGRRRPRLREPRAARAASWWRSGRADHLSASLRESPSPVSRPHPTAAVSRAHIALEGVFRTRQSKGPSSADAPFGRFPPPCSPPVM